jgi:hypothetical protein
MQIAAKLAVPMRILLWTLWFVFACYIIAERF